MKYLFLVACLCLAANGYAQNTTTKDSTILTEKKVGLIQFTDTEYNFGTVVEGDTIVNKFLFTNAGQGSLAIHDVLTTCGCTVPTWEKKPLKPNTGSFIQATFDTEGKVGKQTKVIVVKSDAENETVYLKLKGIVLPKEQSGAIDTNQE